MSGQETLSSANGYHLEWTQNMSCNDSLSQNINAKIAGVDYTLHAKCRKVYAHAHSFNINSISNNSDELKINLWILEVSDQCFNIIDMKPANMENLAGITLSSPVSYSPAWLYRFLDGSLFHMKLSVLEELTASISVARLFDDGIGWQHLISSDYINMKGHYSEFKSTCALETACFMKLPDLFNNELIFDQLHSATGSYGNLLRIFFPANASVEDKVGNIDRWSQRW